MRPRTLLVSPYFDAGLPSGGVLHSIDLTRAWLRRGRCVAVLCADIPRDLGDLQGYADGGQLVLYPTITAEDLRFTHHPNAVLEKQASRVFAEFQPDIIHVHNTQGMMSAIRAAVDSPAPVVLTALDFGLICLNFYLLHASGTHCDGPTTAARCMDCICGTLRNPARTFGPRLPRSITRRLWPRFVRMDEIKLAPRLLESMRHVLGGLDLVVAPSPIMEDRLKAHRAAGGNVVQLLYGVAEDKMLRLLKVPSELLRFAFLGGADRVKGLFVLLEAVDMLPDGLPLEIAALGGENLRQVLENAAPRTRRYFRHRPALFGRALAAAHARFDALLAPSQLHDNSPFAVLEALANGTPVFASDQAGIRHLILEDWTGRLIEPANPAAWARTLLDAVEHPVRLRAMQSNTRYERTTDDFLNDLECLEEPLLSRCPRPGNREINTSASPRLVCEA